MSVQISIENENADVVRVSISHNGYQWSSLRLDSILELMALRDEINDYLLEQEAKGSER
jgi:hypothetical protein